MVGLLPSHRGYLYHNTYCGYFLSRIIISSMRIVCFGMSFGYHTLCHHVYTLFYEKMHVNVC